jgi:hypothetical protein
MKIKFILRESKLNEAYSDSFIQGIADRAKIDISKFSMKELKLGYKTELEHGKKNSDTNVTNDDPVKTLKIAIAHLREMPDYYSKLKKMERS